MLVWWLCDCEIDTAKVTACTKKYLKIPQRNWPFFTILNKYHLLNKDDLRSTGPDLPLDTSGS